MKVTYHGSNQLLDPGTCVEVVWLSGKSILSHVFHKKVEVTVASLALIQVVAKKIREPQHALHLAWGEIKNLDVEKPAGFQLPDHSRSVQVYCTVRDMWEMESDNIDSPALQCFICLDPCEDAPDFQTTEKLSPV